MDDSGCVLGGYVPGAIGRAAELHALYYGREWGFGLEFEALVASGLAEFLQRLDPARDGFWTASLGGRVMGCVAIDGAKAGTLGAHLRWFILSEELRGQGLGDRLLRQAVEFCRACGHPSVYLWTFQGLDTARHLYEKHGFRLAEEREGGQWGKRVMEQRFVLALS
ncbi:MAG: GNAT family N-acetyltransferase [Proteobacteria bacterium]|nr:GNAT family N-acetyltransferase [Pseudomonadota bacterium]